MRVTGAGNVTAPVADALPGKLPQRMITKKAAAGYSSYGNQIGLATTHVREIYSDGYTAKRMEIGAVVGAFVFRLVYTVALRFDMPASMLKAVSSVIVIVAISGPYLKSQLPLLRRRWQSGRGRAVD